MPPSEPLSGPARDVLHELTVYARRHPEASAPSLVYLLALRFIKPRLRRRWRV
jgi:hypothetical protein